MRQLIPRHRIGLLGAGVILCGAFFGCHNPANSSLPPSAISPSGTVVPPLPKGDVYADETVPTSETPIETGDTLEVVIRRGAGEEKFSGVVRENGTAGDKVARAAYESSSRSNRRSNCGPRKFSGAGMRTRPFR